MQVCCTALLGLDLIPYTYVPTCMSFAHFNAGIKGTPHTAPADLSLKQVHNDGLVAREVVVPGLPGHLLLRTTVTVLQLQVRLLLHSVDRGWVVIRAGKWAVITVVQFYLSVTSLSKEERK